MAGQWTHLCGGMSSDKVKVWYHMLFEVSPQYLLSCSFDSMFTSIMHLSYKGSVLTRLYETMYVQSIGQELVALISSFLLLLPR